MDGSESADWAARKIAGVGRRAGFGQPRRRLMGFLKVMLCVLRRAGMQRGRFLDSLGLKRKGLNTFSPVINNGGKLQDLDGTDGKSIVE